MNIDQIVSRLITAAYEQGWRDACHDHQTQSEHAKYPIGRGKQSPASLLNELDPANILGLS